MAVNVFDQAARYTMKLDPQALFAWLLAASGARLVFARRLDTQTIPFPGDPDRRCDTVAELVSLDGSEPPWALVCESQTEPDSDLPDRLLEYMARVRRDLRHGPHGRDRYQVGAAVLSLTGTTPTDTIEMNLPAGVGVEFHWRFATAHFGEKDAPEILRRIGDGQESLCLLPWVPLMRGGDRPETIVQWKEHANRETVTRRKADYGGLARIFADLTNGAQLWRKSLEDWAMKESSAVKEWIAQGLAEGRTTALRNVLLRQMKKRFPQGVPSEMVDAAQNQTDDATLDRWIDAVIDARSAEECRRAILPG
jgi:hypothetical protein